MTSTVNRIFFRRSGTLNMFFKLESVLIMRGSWRGYPEPTRTGEIPAVEDEKNWAAPSAVGEGVAFCRRPAPAERGGQHLDAAAGCFDGLDGGAGEGVGGHGHP